MHEAKQSKIVKVLPKGSTYASVAGSSSSSAPAAKSAPAAAVLRFVDVLNGPLAGIVGQDTSLVAKDDGSLCDVVLKVVGSDWTLKEEPERVHLLLVHFREEMERRLEWIDKTDQGKIIRMIAASSAAKTAKSKPISALVVELLRCQTNFSEVFDQELLAKQAAQATSLLVEEDRVAALARTIEPDQMQMLEAFARLHAALVAAQVPGEDGQ